ncbi:hypothetical protein [Lentzea flaviverrucosa]|uniref:Uncharacterized protein n=1 Tax=Lentzea flaviverrucosa TaxID=200379 RepID=A0A1H9U0W8_9PSEU|nr:hypothetical protein [Lentzea flaviverrucosa]RDI33374.1 hypothetical protein DFR72_102623 [Lentzea flaviverrucosa]SES02918.1 hypothetical protein SAMN05216195_108233 [Lentzea flaviverrucosa]
MDPRDRADAMLARARARGRNIVTPDNMTSPMDSSDTQQIPRALVNAVDPRRDPDSTMILAPAQMSHQQQQRPPHHAPQQPMPTQPMPQQQAPGDDAEITQVVRPGLIPTVSNHQQNRNSLTQRLSGDM